MMEVEASSERPVALASALDSRISGSFRNRYEQELFRNTGQFPIANLLLELLLEGPAIFLAPDIYTLIGAMLLQAWVLARWENTPAPRRFLGNLVGPAAYTAIEACFEGWKFFATPNHVAYWIFAAAVGVLQAARLRAGPGAAAGGRPLPDLEKPASARIIKLCVKSAIESKASPGLSPGMMLCVWPGSTKAPAMRWPRWQPRGWQKVFTGSPLMPR